MKAYKLFRQMKDGRLAPLFIKKRMRVPIGEWMDAECVPTKGFAVRKGWHCTLEPYAPHLSMKGRVWCEVEIEDYECYDRPESQGGTWVLAQRMMVRRIIREWEIYDMDGNSILGTVWAGSTSEAYDLAYDRICDVGISMRDISLDLVDS